MVNVFISSLVDYAVNKKLIEQSDKSYIINQIIGIMELNEFIYTEKSSSAEFTIEEILKGLCDNAVSRGIINSDIDSRDRFDTKLMGALTPRPSEVEKKFVELYKISPKEATDYFYTLAKNSDYIRTYRIEKDVSWVVDSQYGEIDITINLSKPEKDPKQIALEKTLPPAKYPKCVLCPENSGYFGRVGAPARQNHRLIPMNLLGERWFMQYSPYVYYNEHCILLKGEHTPMTISKKTFEKQLAFISQFPHYFVGSNAELPIVGGSILSHDHMQGGRYEFAMARAEIETEVEFTGYSDIKAGIVKWPMSVIRLVSKDSARLCDLADKILTKWRGYSDESAFIFAHTGAEKTPHNTITPIARMRNGNFELDLVLRNNITTAEHPMGVYHPHAELHNIKKENIGLIEVMGLAVLPSRLKAEIEDMALYIKNGTVSECTEKHVGWIEKFKNSYNFESMDTAEVTEVIKSEVGKTFVEVLEHSGVYKRDAAGKTAFARFIASVE